MTPTIRQAIRESIAAGGVPVVLTSFTHKDEVSLVNAAARMRYLGEHDDDGGCTAYVGPGAAWVVILFGDGAA